MLVPFVDLKAQYNQIRDEIHQALDAVLEKQKFILDAEVAQLEQEIAQLSAARFAVACASGTDAILLSLAALGVGESDEVITSSFSFFATAGTIAWLKAKPVFVDIDPGTYNLRTEETAGRITSKTKAIIAVHLFGQCSPVEKLSGLGVPVVEDAAQAISATRKGRPAGSLGIAGCFSFFPTKNLGAYGDGGIVTANDETITAQIRRLRSHGEDSQKYLHHVIGTNSRLDEIQAAVLRVKLRYLHQWNEQRQKHAGFYHRHLRGLPLELPQTDAENVHIYHQFVIKTDARDKLRTFLSDKGVGTAVYYPIPLPLQPCFSHLGYRPGDFPNAEKCSATVLALPVYPELTQQQLEYVVSTIHTFYH